MSIHFRKVQWPLVPHSFGHAFQSNQTISNRNSLHACPTSKKVEVALYFMFKVLNLSQNRLYILPDDIYRLKSLVSFSIEGKHISCKICAVLGNRITSLPDSLGKLSKLQELDVENNPIEQLPCSLGCLRHLKVLRISTAFLKFPAQGTWIIYFISQLMEASFSFLRFDQIS